MGIMFLRRALLKPSIPLAVPLDNFLVVAVISLSVIGVMRGENKSGLIVGGVIGTMKLVNAEIC